MLNTFSVFGETSKIKKTLCVRLKTFGAFSKNDDFKTQYFRIIERWIINYQERIKHKFYFRVFLGEKKMAKNHEILPKFFLDRKKKNI